MVSFLGTPRFIPNTQTRSVPTYRSKKKRRRLRHPLTQKPHIVKPSTSNMPTSTTQCNAPTPEQHPSMPQLVFWGSMFDPKFASKLQGNNQTTQATCSTLGPRAVRRWRLDVALAASGSWHMGPPSESGDGQGPLRISLVLGRE